MMKKTSEVKNGVVMVHAKTTKEVESELVRKIRDMNINEVTASIARKNGHYIIDVSLVFKDEERRYDGTHTDYVRGADKIYEQIKNDVRPRSRMLPF